MVLSWYALLLLPIVSAGLLDGVQSLAWDRTSRLRELEVLLGETIEFRCENVTVYEVPAVNFYSCTLPHRRHAFRCLPFEAETVGTRYFVGIRTGRRKTKSNEGCIMTRVKVVVGMTEEEDSEAVEEHAWRRKELTGPLKASPPLTRMSPLEFRVVFGGMQWLPAVCGPRHRLPLQHNTPHPDVRFLDKPIHGDALTAPTSDSLPPHLSLSMLLMAVHSLF